MTCIKGNCPDYHTNTGRSPDPAPCRSCTEITVRGRGGQWKLEKLVNIGDSPPFYVTMHHWPDANHANRLALAQPSLINDCISQISMRHFHESAQISERCYRLFQRCDDYLECVIRSNRSEEECGRILFHSLGSYSNFQYMVIL